MSDPDIPSEKDPHFLQGINLTEAARIEVPHFVCHECGFDEGLVQREFRDEANPFWKLYYDLRPGNWVEHDGDRYPLDPWRVLLVPASTAFQWHGEGHAPHLWLNFDFASYVGFNLSAPVYIEADEAVRGVAEQLIHLFRHPPLAAPDVWHTSSALLHLCLSRLDACERPPLPERLHSVLGLIHSAYAHKLSNARLAQESGLSVEAFIRWFRGQVGMPPASYVTQARLREAARQLAFTEASIEQIAVGCGFPNRNYMTRLFALRYGSGPAAFRRRYGK